ncbi:AAA family ATPase [Streptomyces monticola]|uniref:AAA family ATPase n=1 Tax=Streptomyces monticola TaxID=2666263 RepID=A0ABW2JB07_9ACTN
MTVLSERGPAADDPNDSAESADSADSAEPAEPAEPAESADSAEPGGRDGRSGPVLTGLRLSAFKAHRGAFLPLGPVTLVVGPSGSGKTSAFQAYEALARLSSGGTAGEAFPDPVACVPEWARPDRQRRRGFRIGCTVDGPAGPVALDLAVQAEPELRIVGERLTAGGVVLLESALRDPARRTVEAAWHTAGSTRVTKAPLPDDRLGTALLPLRVAGKTDGQRRVLAAAEQVVVALRSVFGCDPRPERMRAPARIGDGLLRGGCDNLAEVLRRTRAECGSRHAALVSEVRAGCAGRLDDVLPDVLDDGMVRAVLDRGSGLFRTPVERLGDGELRFLALALVLLTGPGVLAVDPVAEVPSALRALTVLADGFDRCLDRDQARRLVALAAGVARDRGHVRLVAAVSDASWARRLDGVTVVDLGP